MKTIGMILSGCGVQDGSEIHETTLAALHLQRLGARVVFIGIDSPQSKTANHLTGDPSDEGRNMLVESARLARGEIEDISQVQAEDLDALALPGGFGAALNLSDFAVKGEACAVHPEVVRLMGAMFASGRPVGALCIAPAVVAATCAQLGIRGVELTIGNDPGVAGKLEMLGAKHVNCGAEEVVVDQTHKVVTSPAYMVAGNLVQLDRGIAAWADGLMKLLG